MTIIFTMCVDVFSGAGYNLTVNFRIRMCKMYALVEILGKQYKAEAGKEIQVDLVNAELGAQVTYESVLAVVDGEKAKFGAPYVKGASVVATLKSNFKDEKVRVYKFHRRKGYRKTQGHRQQYSILTIDKINA